MVPGYVAKVGKNSKYYMISDDDRVITKRKKDKPDDKSDPAVFRMIPAQSDKDKKKLFRIKFVDENKYLCVKKPIMKDNMARLCEDPKNKNDLYKWRVKKIKDYFVIRRKNMCLGRKFGHILKKRPVVHVQKCKDTKKQRWYFDSLMIDKDSDKEENKPEDDAKKDKNKRKKDKSKDKKDKNKDKKDEFKDEKDKSKDEKDDSISDDDYISSNSENGNDPEEPYSKESPFKPIVDNADLKEALENYNPFDFKKPKSDKTKRPISAAIEKNFPNPCQEPYPDAKLDAQVVLKYKHPSKGKNNAKIIQVFPKKNIIAESGQKIYKKDIQKESSKKGKLSKKDKSYGFRF